MVNFTALTMVFASTILSALGSLLLKIGSTKNSNNKNNVRSFPAIRAMILGAFVYSIATIIFIAALKLGDVSILYPITSLSYIWVCILSAKVLKERISAKKIAGIMLIVIGVVIITL